ncbi:hypothetical protein WJX73_001952 [Symbiochloris irregularis]|uniref:Ketoreductase domain-containing protein n=1 Tax=Symbiochloris irregularis TaxID=706552 RepID=A0AAW1NUT9_9CHLO
MNGFTRNPITEATDTLHHSAETQSLAAALDRAAHGAVIVITGAGGGIGRAIALAFGKAGASQLLLIDAVANACEATAAELRQLGAKSIVRCYELDLTSDDAEQRLNDVLQDAGNRCDCLVNNAGILGWSPIAKFSLASWKKVFDINVHALFLCTHVFLPALLSQQGGTIINLASISGVEARPGEAAYGTSKTCAARFTDFLDAEHRKDGIRSFAIHPGGVRTDFLRGRFISANWDLQELEARANEIVDRDLLKLKLAV